MTDTDPPPPPGSIEVPVDKYNRQPVPAGGTPAPTAAPVDDGGGPPPPPGSTLVQPYDGTPSPPESDPNYSPWGYVGGPQRAIAPLEVGGVIGGVLGAPLGPPGIAGGALIGAGTASLLEGAEGLYNLGAYEFGWPHLPTVSDATEKVQDWFGVPKATTPGQRMESAAVGAVADIATGAGGARLASGIRYLPGPVRRFTEGMSKNPVRQTIAGVTGAEAAQGARETGVVEDPVASTLLGMAAGRWSGPVTRTMLPGRPSSAAQVAHDHGYVLHPGEISTGEEGLPATVLAATGGKIKNWQHAQHLNMDNTQRLAREDFRNADGTPRFPPGTVFDEDGLEQVAKEAAADYQRVADALGGPDGGRIQTRYPITTDTQVPHPDPRMGVGATQLHRETDLNQVREYHAAIDRINDVDAEAREAFPEDMKNEEVEALQRRMHNYNNFTPGAALGFIKKLRSDAKGNFAARDQPNKLALGVAQRRAADALENLLDDHFSERIKDPNMMARFKQARETIAKTWDYRYAMRSNGTIDPSRLAGLTRMSVHGTRRRILSGNAKAIADSYSSFPHNIKLPTGPDEKFSILDLYGAAIALASGHVGGAVAIAGRPIARSVAASPGFQNYQFGMGNILSRLGMPATPGRTPRAVGRSAIIGQGAQSGPGGSLYPEYTGDGALDTLMRGEVPRWPQ